VTRYLSPALVSIDNTGFFNLTYPNTERAPVAATAQPIGGVIIVAPTQTPTAPMVRKLFGNFAKLIFLRVEMLERLILIPYPE
tara:strand:+ start:317 stop:565 length:249 start_codon:yes stop_codon:yes gene_type:complete